MSALKLDPFYPVLPDADWVARIAAEGAKFIQLRAKDMEPVAIKTEIARALDEHAPLRRAYEGLGKTLEFAMKPAEAIDSYKTMLSFGEEHNDPAMQISALNKMSYTHAFVLGQMPEARECLTRAETLAREAEEVGGLVEAVTHKTAWTVNHGTEIKMAQGLTTAIEGGPA